MASSEPQAYYEPVMGEEDEDEGKLITYGFPEEPSVFDYALHPYRSFNCFMATLVHNFGMKFAIQIGVMYLCVKGSLNSVMGLIKLSYCKKTLNIDGNACQTMMSVAMTPWAIKGALGVMADAYPLFGYHKKWYIILSSIMGTCAFTFLAAVPLHQAAMAASLMFLCNLQIATCDLLCEGKYAELMQRKPKTGSTMVSYVWGLFQLGSFFASVFVGPIADAYDPRIIFWGCIPLAASIIIPTYLNYLSDEEVPEEKRGFDWELVKEHPYIIAFCLIMAAVALGNAILDLVAFDSHLYQMLYAVGTTVGLSILAFRWLPRQLAMCNFYMFISCVLYINISGAQDFWFTADEKCVPGGPGFDYTYYNTYASLVGSVTGWLGIVLFQWLMSDWNFRTLFWMTTLIQIVASGFDMIMIARLNIEWGISDKAFYMFGDAVIGNVVGMFGLMPMLVLTSKLVPKGLEATTYALLAGFQNFGGVVSSQIGIYATQFAGVKTKDPCDFTNLNLLVSIYPSCFVILFQSDNQDFRVCVFCTKVNFRRFLSVIVHYLS
mmetsp:Transcript_12405/g.19551  ORF Transcript_12405/g.19551 Transcript_12405/m.19551 type:complete len:548 (+) Transcript_12405:195-1838(+)